MERVCRGGARCFPAKGHRGRGGGLVGIYWGWMLLRRSYGLVASGNSLCWQAGRPSAAR